MSAPATWRRPWNASATWGCTEAAQEPASAIAAGGAPPRTGRTPHCPKRRRWAPSGGGHSLPGGRSGALFRPPPGGVRCAGCWGETPAGEPSRVITLAMGHRVAAPLASLWAALTEPGQVLRWRPGVVGVLDPLDRYPEAGQRVRWSCRIRELPLILEETPLVVVPLRHLRRELALGLFRYEESIRLSPSEGSGGSRIAIKISAPNQMPVVGGSLDRFAVRRFATELAGATLQALRDWCEGLPAPNLRCAGPREPSARDLRSAPGPGERDPPPRSGRCRSGPPWLARSRRTASRPVR